MIQQAANVIALVLIALIGYFTRKYLKRVDQAVNSRPPSDPKLYDVAKDTKKAVDDRTLWIRDLIHESQKKLEDQLRDHRRIVFDKLDRSAVDQSVRLKGIEDRVSGVDERVAGIDSRIGGVERRMDRVDGRLGNVERHIRATSSPSPTPPSPDTDET